MIGTKRTPPPTPPNTATMPSKKVTINNTNGHIHQGVGDSGIRGAAADGSVDANTEPTNKYKIQRVIKNK